MKHKHDWRKVGATYSDKKGLVTTKKRCIICKKEKQKTNKVRAKGELSICEMKSIFKMLGEEE